MRNAVEAVKDLTRGAGADLVMECSGAATAINDAVYATKRGGRICLAAFPHDRVLFDAAQLVRHNIYLYGVRGEGRGAVKRGLALMAQGKISGRPFITRRFGLDELPRALETAEKRLEATPSRSSSGPSAGSAGGRPRRQRVIWQKPIPKLRFHSIIRDVP